jgi:hypothetical protein
MHLKMYGVSDSLLNSEAKLLLARAGKDFNFILCALPVYFKCSSSFTFIFKGIFEDDESRFDFTICPRHREMYGIRWRCNKKTCVCPSEWAGHKSVKSDRGLTLPQSKKLFQETQVLIPVASHEFLARFTTRLNSSIRAVNEFVEKN